MLALGTCGADDNQAQGGHLVAYGGNNTRGPIDVRSRPEALMAANSWATGF